MLRYFNREISWSLIVAVFLSFGLLILRAQAAPPEPERGSGHGQGVTHQDDPCDHLPDPPGNANGIDKNCPAGGSSSGVAKGDFNGDGFADLAIGEPGAAIGGKSAAGDVIVIYGSANGLTTNTSGIPGRQLFYEGRVPGTSAEAGDRFGSALASGDFNNDGYSDLAIGIPYKTTSAGTHSGEVVVIYGSPTGLSLSNSTLPALNVLDPGKLYLVSCSIFGCVSPNFDEGHFGSSLAWGDFNHDGAGDLAAGAPALSGNYLFVAPLPKRGGVIVFYGKTVGTTAGGLSLTGIDLLGDNDPRNDDDFGAALAAGDFNGDGYTDLAVGIPHADLDTSSRLFTDAGKVVILPGSSGGLTNSGSQTWSQENSGIIGGSGDYDHFGAAVASGDFNGDGKADVAIGVPGKNLNGVSNVGAVNVIYGSTSLLTSSGNQRWHQDLLSGVNNANDQFGLALGAGDFNGDGKIDLAIGVPYKDVAVAGRNFADAGEVDVIYGSGSGLSTSSHIPQVVRNLLGITAGDHFGAALTAWNFGRNEQVPPLLIPRTSADLAVGIPYQDVNGVSNAGAINVFYGSFVANGLTTSNSVAFTADSIGIGGLAGANFGGAMY